MRTRDRSCVGSTPTPTAPSKSTSDCRRPATRGAARWSRATCSGSARAARPPAFLKLHFDPGEVAQADWGEYGTIAVGSTRRRLSFFLMVLGHSRRMYLEFTVSQTMEFFLACHENAFGTPLRPSAALYVGLSIMLPVT